MKVTINRNYWDRGSRNKGDEIYLLKLQTDGDIPEVCKPQLCCMGFAALEAGALPDEILGVNALPERKVPDWVRPFTQLTEHGGITPRYGSRIDIYAINDDSTLTDEQREQLIQWLGAQYGIEFEFVG